MPEHLLEFAVGGSFLCLPASLFGLFLGPHACVRLFERPAGFPDFSFQRGGFSGIAGAFRRCHVLAQPLDIRQLFLSILVCRGYQTDLRSSFIAIHIEENRADDDDTGKKGLVVGLQVHGREPDTEYRHDENTDERPEDGTDATRQGSSPDDGTGDGVELKALAGGGQAWE